MPAVVGQLTMLLTTTMPQLVVAFLGDLRVAQELPLGPQLLRLAASPTHRHRSLPSILLPCDQLPILRLHLQLLLWLTHSSLASPCLCLRFQPRQQLYSTQALRPSVPQFQD